MSDANRDPWASGGADQASGDPLPAVTDLVSKAASKVMEDFVPFLVGGLPFLGLVLVAAFVGVGLGMFSVFGVSILGAAVGEDELAGLLAVVVLVGGTLVLMAGITALAAPMAASLMRAVWQLLETGEKLTIGSAFSTIGQDLVKVILYNIVLMVAVLTGSLFCYIPGLLIAAAFQFAGPAIVIHRLPIGAAIGLSVSHMQRNPGWHLGFFALSVVLALILSYIPFIGYALLATIHPLFVLLAYREVFGTGELPRGYPG